MVKDPGDGVTYGSHHVLYRTSCLVGIGAVAAFLVRRFADATDRGQGAVENPDDLAQGNVFGRLDEGVAAFHAAPARQKAGTLEGEKNLFQEFHRDVLSLRDIVALQRGLSVGECQFQEGP